MSRFDDAISAGLESMIYQCGDPIEYWPAGEEDDAIEIEGIFTATRGMEAEAGSMRSDTRMGELQIFADAERGVVNIDLRNDIAVINSGHWRVTEVYETVAGMHRLQVEWADRAAVRRTRGRW